MPLIKRRQFLQFTGSALATLGLNQLDVQQRGDRYARVLAQSTPRKLALLVGINAYPDGGGYTALEGCVNDIELQRQLLTHRFGFNDKDIYSLTNAQANRKGILEAFEEHLIKQSKPGDVVVFHYSGHGSLVSDPDRDNPDGLNGTFVPVDAHGFSEQSGIVQDIMGHTLFLLMSALPTENVTVVLDSCYSGGGTRGNFRIRAREGGSQLQASPAEKEYQNQWLSRLKLSPQEFVKQRRAGVAKGVVIAAAKRDELAADASFNGFYAGAFTYLMTQYLWQQTSSQAVGSVISTVSRSTTQISSTQQQPLIEKKPGSRNEQQPVYFTKVQMPPAEAVIRQVKGSQVELWLGGVEPESFEAFQKDTTFSAINAKGDKQGRVKLESRQGLVGRGKLLQGAGQRGALLQEESRAIPSDLKLRIGLDASLGGDTERAKQSLKAIGRIEAVPARPGNVPYTGEVHYILGRITAANQRSFQLEKGADLPAIASIGLFSPGGDPVPGSFGAAGETVTAALTRLQAKLKSLLAARIVKLALNANSSRLNVTASMSPEGQTNQVIAQIFTPRGSVDKQSAQTKPTPVNIQNASKLPLGTPIQFRITNSEPQPLYVSVLVIDSTREITVVFPNQWAAAADAAKVETNQTLLIPDRAKGDDFSLVIQEPKGTAEVLIITSRSPLKKALLTLQSLAAERGQQRGPIIPDEPVEAISALLDDLSTRSGNAEQQDRTLDTTQIAALSLTFEVV